MCTIVDFRTCVLSIKGVQENLIEHLIGTNFLQ